ncbi:MAG: hypothetical protein KAT69_00080 [Candidatus Aminicenantes bacterium]|nr:hypothetical protein [Candidatus Aminicenantes bacterium]
MLDKTIDFIYGKIPGFLAILIFIPTATLFLIFLMLINIKKIHRPIDEWE